MAAARMGRGQRRKKSRVVHTHAARGHQPLFKPMLSHLHAGLSLACSVASLSHPSDIICQIIMNYSIIALETAS